MGTTAAHPSSRELPLERLNGNKTRKEAGSELKLLRCFRRAGVHVCGRFEGSLGLLIVHLARKVRHASPSTSPAFSKVLISCLARSAARAVSGTGPSKDRLPTRGAAFVLPFYVVKDERDMGPRPALLSSNGEQAQACQLQYTTNRAAILIHQRLRKLSASRKNLKKRLPNAMTRPATSAESQRLLASLAQVDQNSPHPQVIDLATDIGHYYAALWRQHGGPIDRLHGHDKPVLAALHDKAAQNRILARGAHIALAEEHNLHGLQYSDSAHQAHPLLPELLKHAHPVRFLPGVLGPQANVIEHDRVKIFRTLEVTDAWIHYGYASGQTHDMTSHLVAQLSGARLDETVGFTWASVVNEYLANHPNSVFHREPNLLLYGFVRDERAADEYLKNPNYKAMPANNPARQEFWTQQFVHRSGASSTSGDA